MKRLLLGLLRLLLQLLIFALAGRWVRIGEPQPKPSGRKRAKPPPLPSRKRAPKPQASRGPMFDATAGAPRGRFEDVAEPAREWRSVEATSEPYASRSHASLAGPYDPPAQRGKRKGVVEPARRRAPPPLRSVKLARQSPAAALRDPVKVREALIVGALLGPRPPRR